MSNSVNNYVIVENTNPGPGDYNTDNLKVKNTPAFSMSEKTKDHSRTKTEETPGPGNYRDSEVFSANNSYVLSTHKKSIGALISPRETPKHV